jgi:hypothetical protein
LIAIGGHSNADLHRCPHAYQQQGGYGNFMQAHVYSLL